MGAEPEVLALGLLKKEKEKFNAAFCILAFREHNLYLRVIKKTEHSHIRN